MAKDGTLRGGARVGAGKKRKSLEGKVLDGRAAEHLVVADLDDLEADELEGADMPKPSAFLKSLQKDGSKLQAEQIYKRTFAYLKSVGCHKLVSPGLVEQYSMMYARYMACEEEISKHGYLAKHPTTGLPTTSPYVNMSQNFAKQATIAWNQIFQIVKENASENFISNPDDAMEILLRRKKK